ncbi:MAG TPA: hypothetical protein ENK16_01335 [Chromatiales bacterium]|nr:hypothetical protein [Chromatiales bacterium]
MILLLASCNGGIGTNVAGIDRGGVHGGVSIGVVTGFGSIYVNNSHYLTDQASVFIDGSAASVSDLELGQVVVVQAELTGSVATATRIDFESNLIGPVANIDLAGGRFDVLQQPVMVSADTFFGAGIVPAGLDGLNNGDAVRVSGLVDINGTVLATRIDRVSGAPSYELLGTVQNIDTGVMTFSIGTLVVDYSGAASVSGFPGGEPRNGDRVRVTGNSLGGAGELQADELEFRPGSVSVAEGEHLELEGFITRFVDATDFDVDGVPVTTDTGTQFEGGSASALALNQRVEVEGDVGAGGVLLADKVELEQEGELRIEATVDSVDAAAGRLVMLGIPVQADGLTGLESINAGDCVKVHGHESTSAPGTVIATRLEREDACGTVALRGQVGSLADPQFTILGVTIDTDASTNFESGAAAFFVPQTVGRLVEARGSATGSGLLASEVEFKGD